MANGRGVLGCLAVTCNDFMSFEIWSNMVSESTSADIEGSVFQVLEGPTTSSNAMNAFVGSKERVRIPLLGKHCSLQAFVKLVVEHAGLREEAQKRGLVSSIDIKLCRLEKGPDGNKAYAINTQAQRDEERSKPCSVTEEWFRKVRHIGIIVTDIAGKIIANWTCTTAIHS